jgi:hypothetical protein
LKIANRNKELGRLANRREKVKNHQLKIFAFKFSISADIQEWRVPINPDYPS